jgi:hypothetical protein
VVLLHQRRPVRSLGSARWLFQPTRLHVHVTHTSPA